jgi:hypothetical protein
MKFTVLIKILAYFVTPLLDRKRYPQGIYWIPEIFKKTKSLLGASNLELTRQVWKLYARIYIHLPVQDPKDLQEEWTNSYP